MSLADFTAQERPPKTSAKAPEVPKGWERGFESDGRRGTITTGPTTETPTPALWAQVAKDIGLDVDQIEFIGPHKSKGWSQSIKGTAETVWHTSYSVRWEIKGASRSEDAVDIDKLLKLASKRKPPRKKAPAASEAERALVVLIGDTQAGKGEGGGSEALIERVVGQFAAVIERLAELKKVGRPVGCVYCVTLGDLIEGCRSNYASQQFTVDLTRTEQTTVVRRLLINFIDQLVDAGYPVVLSGVAGNHGEHRDGSGKAFTTPEDNDDLAVLGQVADVLAGNPERYANVSTFIPEALSMSLDICGVICGFYHGHIGSPKQNVTTKLANWWTGQIVGGGPTGHASVLFSAHYHHLVITEASGRSHIQIPGNDGGSRFFTESTGKSSPPGLLTVVVGQACGPRGYDDMKVI